MATFASARSLAASQSKRFGLVSRAIRVEHKKLVHTVADRMVDMASGRISTKELARRGHPFGRKKGRITMTVKSAATANQRFRAHKTRPVVPTPLMPINRQSGELIRSLRIIPEHGGAQQSYRVQFTSPHAVVLSPGGTKNMVARGYWPAVKRVQKSENAKTVYQMRLLALKLMYAS